jgi:CRISPR system Cascade subunit CasB
MPMPRKISVPREADRLAREIMLLTAKSPGDRSVLRHSLGRPPEDVVMGVHRIVAPLLPRDVKVAEERAYYAVAALIASQDRSARDQATTDDEHDGSDSADPEGTAGEAGEDDSPGRPNLGYSLAQLAHKSSRDRSRALGDRLELLARQDVDGLYRHLPRLIHQVRADQVSIDWGVLIRDLTRWAYNPRQVAKEWAQDFYRTSERLLAAQKRKAEQAANGTHDEENMP